jgi:hypothetical protein
MPANTHKSVWVADAPAWAVLAVASHRQVRVPALGRHVSALGVGLAVLVQRAVQVQAEVGGRSVALAGGQLGKVQAAWWEEQSGE